jgi:serine/threonine protein kinase
MNELDLFAAAISLVDPGERAALLDRECAGRPELRQRLDQLLAAHFQSNPLLDAPAAERTADYTPSSEPATSAGPAAEAVGTLIAGRYKLLEEIGEGGMGTVWVAEQTQPVRRKVALKLIKAGMDSRQVLARFEAERQALAVMDHPNIAKVLDGGLTEAGRPFFAMEYVKGVPITEYCDAARLGVPERLQLFTQVCQAVQHAHQKGIIHRDLKPSNILVAPYDDKPVPKIIDFGLAKAMHQSLTEKTLHTAHGTVMGTPLYMSPEQAQLNNLDIDTRSDIYSLGVLLYELLTGTTPLERQRFQQAAWDEIRRLIREEEPPRPSMRLSSAETLPSLAAVRQSEPARLTKLVRGDLDWIVMKALEKDRGRRYETANGFAMDVRRHLSGEPVQAAPPSAAYRIKKFARKHRAGLATAAVIASLLVAGVAVSSWQAYRATRAEGRALVAAEAERKAKNAEAEERRKAETAAAAEKSARQRAETAEASAKRDLAKFEAINEFLTKDLLTQAEPANNAAEDRVTLLEVLDRAAEKVGDRFKDQPELDEALRGTIAQTYHGLGSWKKAERQFRAQRESALHRLGPGSTEALGATGRIGHILQHSGRMAEALPMLESAAEGLRRKLGADHPDILFALDNLAGAYRDAGKLPEAIALFEQIRDIRVKKQGADHADTLPVLNNLALAYQDAGRVPEAITLLEQVREALLKKLGADHPNTLHALHNLAAAYRAVGKLSEAITLFRQVRDVRVKKLGADHPDTLLTLNNLASAYQAAGKLPEAIALYEQVKGAQVKTLGADDPDTLTTLHNLAGAYLAAGKLNEALPLFEQAATGMAKRRFQHQYAGPIITNTIAAYEQAGQVDKAEVWRRQWLAVVKQEAGADSPAYAGELAALGLNLLQQKKMADAEPILRECLAIREKKERDDWRMFNTQSLLGGALLSQKNYAEAEPLLLKGYEGMKVREKTIPRQASTRIPEAVGRLIDLYTATNKPDEVKKWQAERAKYPATAPPLGKK